MKNSCSFMITNFNGKELLERIIPSVMEALNTNQSPEDEIVVVDDASSDGSTEMIRKRFPKIQILALETNVGFQQASNRGVEFCKNNLVICLNNDMMVERDCREKLAAHFQKDTRLFAVSTKVLMWDKKTYLAGRRYALFQEGNLILKDENVPSLSTTFFATGGGCMVDRKKFLDLGGFDKLYEPLYWEDIDISYRAWKRGYRVLYDPDVVFYHKHQATISELMNKKAVRSLTARNSYLFLWKNITDSYYFKQHLKNIFPSLFKNILKGDTRFPIAFFKAFARIFTIMKARRIEKVQTTINDRKIIEMLSPQ